MYQKRPDTVGEITIRRQKPLVLRIMVEQGRTMVLFLSELVSRCEQIFPHRCCFQPVRRIRQREHANSWGLVPSRVGSRLTERGWAGGEAGMASGQTHEISVAGPSLMKDDVPSRWRGEDHVTRKPGSAS